MTGNDPYAVLGLMPGADPAAVRRAWRRCARATHPDAGGDRAEFERARRAAAMLLPRTSGTIGAEPAVRPTTTSTATLVRHSPRLDEYYRTKARTWSREIVEPAEPAALRLDFATILAEELARTR